MRTCLTVQILSNETRRVSSAHTMRAILYAKKKKKTSSESIEERIAMHRRIDFFLPPTLLKYNLNSFENSVNS